MNQKETLLNAMKQAVIELEEEIKREQPQGQQMMYTFVYEQQYSDAPGWGPNYQYIYAHSVGQAFAILGRVVDEMKLTIRNVRYGFYEEMEPEIEQHAHWWKEQRRKT